MKMRKTSLVLALCLGAGITLLAGRRSRQLLQTVTPQQTLQHVATIPIYRWSYRWSKPGITHLGPMAQDFYRAFNVGASPRTINLLDVAGVLLASVQALDAQVQELQVRTGIENPADQEVPQRASAVPAV